jgi:hypothetical protein
MTQTFKARQMVPSRDTIAVMALHYGLKPSIVRDVIKRAGAKLIREDGFRGTLVSIPGASRVRWSDGVEGVDPKTTKLTRKAITAVSRWKFEQSLENDKDN